MLRFSIVTPTLDRRDMLREAIASLRSQRGDFTVEHIVVDGGSTDGTQAMLAAQGGIRLLRDRGRGLYDAVNTGIEASTGEVVGLLNSDDLLPPGALAAIADALRADPAAEAACGAVELFGGDSPIRRLDDRRDLVLDPHAALIGSCLTNARFFRRRVFDRVGLFSTAYRRVADREFLARTLLAGVRTVPVPALVYRYRRHPGSLTFHEGAGRSEEYREELLRLARQVAAWHGDPAGLAGKARALEGRCLLVLALRRLQRGALAQAWRTLFHRAPDATATPPLAIAAAVADRLGAFGRD
jgi:glycosyltransferase involved in cell wall biosynthesis